MADLPGMAPMGSQSDASTAQQLHLKPGDTLAGRYEIKEQIGAGGMGAVYHALDKTRGEDVALKVLLPALIGSASAKERFMDEARLSSKLSHPNIVNVFDVQQDEDYVFLSMELLVGQDLRALMENRKLTRTDYSEEEAKQLAQKLCEALGYAHQHTVHRDIKPENIWITEEGEVKVMDFGIARVMSNSQRTQTGVAMGTAYYMAPEQLKGAAVDGRADIYALGVMLYELLTGDVPAGRIKPIKQIRSDLSKGFSNAIDQALEPDPAERYADMSAFSEALNKKGGGVSAPGINPKIAGIAAGVLLLIGIGVMAANGGLSDALKGLLPESEEVIQARYNQAIQLQGEVQTLLKRLEKERQQIESTRRDWQQEAKRLESQLRTAREGKKAIEQAMHDAEAQTEHWQAVEALADEVVYESTAYTQLQGQLNVAEQLLRDKNTQGAIGALTPAKATLTTMLSQAESTEAMVTDGKAVRDARGQWQQLIRQAGWEQLSPVLKGEKVYQSARLAESDGRFDEARSAYSALLEEYSKLPAAVRQLVAAQSPLEKAKGEWESYAGQRKLSDIPQAKALSERYRQYQQYERYQQAHASNELVAAAEAAVQLKQEYGDLLSGAQNAKSYRDKAQQAKSDWESYATTNKLTTIPQHNALAQTYSKADTDYTAGDLPGAGVAFKQLTDSYVALLKEAKGVLDARLSADKARKAFEGYVKAGHASAGAESKAQAKFDEAATTQSKGDLSGAHSQYLAAEQLWGELNQGAEVKRSAERRRQLIAMFSTGMISIPAGSFSMGSDDGESKEQPVHTVYIKPFKLGKYEVTQQQWQAVMGNNPSNFKGCDSCPVERVSWNDTQGFVKKLNQLTGKTFRLPSEAEWEYACRSGGKNEAYCGGSSASSLAWYKDNSGSKTHPAGQKQANGLGLYDMSGNVTEWTQDCWNSSYNGAPTNGSARQSGDCEYRIARGGDWARGGERLRSAYRAASDAFLHFAIDGFRLAQDAP
jgi:formylglycine-generating enzyme required for sulfatase activity